MACYTGLHRQTEGDIVPRISFRLHQNELDDLERKVEEDPKLENRSQAIRTAIRQFTKEEERDFERAR